jgi:hypothetical protein
VLRQERLQLRPVNEFNREILCELAGLGAEARRCDEQPLTALRSATNAP